MPTTWNALFLGNSATFLDGAEGNVVKENAGAFVGNTYGSIADPLAKHIVRVTAINNGGISGLDDDNTVSNDQISYDLGGGPQTEIFDAHVEYSATLTYFDGTTATVTAVIFQDKTGNLFLAPEIAANGGNADSLAYEAQAIRSITLDAVTVDSWSDLFTDRHDAAFVCFAAGTRIDTPSGPRPVQSLAPGDLVRTLDNGPQPVLWCGSRQVRPAPGKEAIRIAQGALGNGCPARPLIVSPQHRVLLHSAAAGRMAGSPEVLIPAVKLLGAPGITRARQLTMVRYHHILCARHELVLADGAWCETLLPGPQAQSLLGPRAWDEITCLLRGRAAFRAARPLLCGRRSRRLLQRLAKNRKPLRQTAV